MVVYCMTNCTLSIPLSMLKFQHLTVQHRPEVWHRRLGHLNYTYMNQLMEKEMVDGMNHDSGTQTQKDCEACVLGKMQKKPFPQ